MLKRVVTDDNLRSERDKTNFYRYSRYAISFVTGYPQVFDRDDSNVLQPANVEPNVVT